MLRSECCDEDLLTGVQTKGGNDMFDMNKKAENKEAQAPKNAVKRPADEISEEALRQIVGGATGDVREGISGANADPSYAAGKMNDVDGWE